MKNYISKLLLTGLIFILIATLSSYFINMNQVEFIGTGSEWKYDYSRIGLVIFLSMLVLNLIAMVVFYFKKDKLV